MPMNWWTTTLLEKTCETICYNSINPSYLHNNLTNLHSIPAFPASCGDKMLLYSLLVFALLQCMQKALCVEQSLATIFNWDRPTAWQTTIATDSLWTVAAFVDRPSCKVAIALHQSGWANGHWQTAVPVGRVKKLLAGVPQALQSDNQLTLHVGATMQLALFPGAEEGGEKECLAHTTCAWA